jgi:hypothetical protein
LQETIVPLQQALATCRKQLYPFNRLLQLAGNNCTHSTGSCNLQEDIEDKQLEDFTKNKIISSVFGFL